MSPAEAEILTRCRLYGGAQDVVTAFREAMRVYRSLKWFDGQHLARWAISLRMGHYLARTGRSDHRIAGRWYAIVAAQGGAR